MNRTRMLWVIVFVVVALSLRLFIALNVDVPVSGDAIHYLEMAEEIRSNHRYALNDRITAHRPPLYPLFLAMFPSVSEGQDLIRVLQCIMSAGVLILLTPIFIRDDEKRIGLIATLFVGALSPSWIYYSATLLSEIFFAFLFSLSMFVLLMGLSRRREYSQWLLVLSGVLLGLATLTRSVVLLLPPFLVILSGALPGYRRLIKPLLLVALVWGLTLAPWTIRNFIRFDSFIPVNTMGGIVLWQGANPSPDGFGFTPWEEIDRAAGTHDEVERNRILTQKALATYWDNPIRTLRLAGLKFLWFWNPWDGDTYRFGSPFNPHTFAVIVLSGCFLLQLWMGGGKRQEGRSPFWILTAVLIYFLVMALLFYGSPRFRMPVEPILWISAGFGFAGILQLDRARREFVLASLLGLILTLYLAGDWVKEGLRSVVEMMLGYREFWGQGSL